MIPHVVVSFVVSNSGLVAFVSIYLRLLSFALTQHLSLQPRTQHQFISS